DVGAMQAALQETPEILHGVRVNIPIYVFNCVIDNRVLVVVLQSLIRLQLITENCCTSLDVFTNLLLKFLLASAIDHEGANIAAPFDHAHDNGLILTASASNNTLTLRPVHIAGLAADECFIYFDFAAKLAAIVILQCKPNSVE